MQILAYRGKEVHAVTPGGGFESVSTFNLSTTSANYTYRCTKYLPVVRGVLRSARLKPREFNLFLYLNKL